jgi:hypothetical protein
MSFHPLERESMEYGFPSKLTDFTATGLPLLVYGPPYCSAVRWARQNAGVAAVVDDEGERGLNSALEAIQADEEYRRALASTSLAKGAEFFDHGVIAGKFHYHLTRG